MDVREDVGMSRSQLDAYGEGEPIWGFVALLGEDRFTGQADVGVSPRLHLYAIEGRVYFAERDGDAPIESRFVSMGVVSAEQLERGAVRVGEGVSLARLFTRDPSIDRDAVELALEMMTAHTLEAVAMEPTGAVALSPLRHHATGIQQWRTTQASETVDGEPPTPTGTTTGFVQVEVANPATLPTLGTWNPPSADDRQKTGEYRYSPSDFAAMNLPKLASRPISVGEITAAQAAASAAPEPTEDLASLVQRITDADLADPDLADPGPATEFPSPFDAQAHQPPAFHALPLLASSPPSTLVTSTFAQIVKTPPSTPAVEQGMDLEAMFAAPPAPARPAHEVPFDTTAWAPTVSPQTTADEIWVMIDDMFALHGVDDTAADPGEPSDKKPRGWRRGKKG
jgi:hypothetical protein